MKKINEEVIINDPALAQQYANGQTQLLNKDKQINALQKQINLIEQGKNDIAKKMAEIEKKSAQSQGDQVVQQLDQQQQAVQTSGQPAQQGTMTSESILINEDDEPRFSGKPMTKGRMIYQDGKLVGTDDEVWTRKESKLTVAQEKKDELYRDQMTKIGYDIDDIKLSIQYIQDDLNSITETPEGQEEADAEIIDRYGWNVLDYFNGGNKDTKELKKMGVENPKDVIEMYDYAHPDINDLEKQRAPLLKELKKYNKELEKLQKKYNKIEDKSNDLYSDKYNKKRRFTSIHGKDSQRKTAPNVYDNANPLSIEKFYDMSEAYVDDRNKFDGHPNEEIYDEKSYVFYVRLTDITNQNEFIGKIFKTSPDGEWYSVVADGEADSFEQISYDARYDQSEIVEFLKETFDEVEIIDIEEFDNYIEGDVDVEDWEVRDVDESGMTGLNL